MKFMSKRVVLWLLMSIVFLYLVALFTTSPEVTSGNGNLGLVFVFPAVIIFLLFAKSIWRSLGILKLQPGTWKIVSLGSLFILLFCCFLEYQYTLNLIDQLGGTPAQESSRIYRYPWLNQYTNTLFINGYTFLILNSGVVFLYSILKKES
ncbi:hypothetical protein [Bacillus sp. 03113]|uniref:hypothetical protein n=1 Tax=Bacillus sp. 03113 TaxID=2578211 RepID=UPI0011442B2A|nr:hypothetical protein [Bacillus sp. 03113]